MGTNRVMRRGHSYLVAARQHLLDDRSLRAEVDRLLPGVTVAEDADEHRRPVVLVHGWIARKSSWARTIANLHGRGFTDLHTAGYDVWRDDIHAAGARVGRRLVEVAERHDVDRVDVVAQGLLGDGLRQPARVVA